MMACGFESVKVVLAVPESAPVAVTLYVAMNHSGRPNVATKAPSSPAVTSSSYRQVSPTSSFTRMWTASPACHPEPVSVTCSPGA